MEILREQQTPGGLVQLRADQKLNARGRVLTATLTVAIGEEIVWVGPDTPENAPRWRVALETALAGVDEPATPKKRGKK